MKMIFDQVSDQRSDSLAARFRRLRAARILGIIQQIAAEKGGVRIIDLGGDPGYWNRLFARADLEAANVHITTVNPHVWEPSDDPMIEAVEGDACGLPQYADASFDFAHSNSVIEHVGDWDKVEAFAAEHRRLAPRYYAQTPYYWFPIEPHFSAIGFQWRSEQARARMLMKRDMGWSKKARDIGEAMAQVQSARLLDKTQFRHLFPDAQMVDETVLGLTKSLRAIRA
jgi:hypothetical protein